MYDLSDTVVAVGSPAGGARSILRITGAKTLSICDKVFAPDPSRPIRSPQSAIRNSHIRSGSMRVTDALAVEALLYLFIAPHSYTGEDLAEIHVHASRVIVERLLQNLLALGLRAAGPGEFTARAYLNGKLDLAQAEAVNEVISSSNRLQLEAAERLLDGRLTKAADEVRSALLDILSLIEAGLDFSGEDIEFISPVQAAERLRGIQTSLEGLLASSIRYETLLDLPSIGIAGAPNAGKSSLLNALLGSERSIVSHQPKTTRDVLSGVLIRDRGGRPEAGDRSSASGLQPPASDLSFRCVLFDCAGLVPAPDNVLDELAQRAAIEALNRCTAVLFCVDAAKTDIDEDIALRSVIRPKTMIYIATKSDLLAPAVLSERVRDLTKALGADFVPVSARTGLGLGLLLDHCGSLIADNSFGTHHESAIRHPPSEISAVALTIRHRQAVTEAIENIREAVVEVNRGHEEVAVMMIRAAHQAISEIGQQSIDERVLERIFSRFCIGK